MMVPSGQSSSCKDLSVYQYFNLLRFNRSYRLYLLSHCMQHTGDWFIRIALLLAVERLAPNSATAVSVTVLCKLLPEVVITPFGGILSDRFDRKMLMITLDSVAAVSTLTFLIALNSGNVVHLYLSTTLRSIITSLYEPITKSIFPMFITNSEDLLRAATLNGSAWVRNQIETS